ncbi:hypothetical protein BH24ACT7_BH24ACT7_24200 [soil metagenome]
MFLKAGMIIAWAVGTIATTGIAVGAVRSVADQVVDEAPPVAAAVTSSSNGGSVTSSSNGGSVTSSTRVRRPRQTTTTNGGSVTSTSGGSTTSTTNGGSTTSTTGVPTSTATYNLIGGWVTISYGPGIVELVSAAPNPGFSIEVKETGPDRVEVEFESDDHESRFRADATDAGPPEIRIEEID